MCSSEDKIFAQFFIPLLLLLHLQAELGQADEEIDIATNSVNHYDKQLKDWDSKIETQETDMNKFYAEEIEVSVTGNMHSVDGSSQ